MYNSKLYNSHNLVSTYNRKAVLLLHTSQLF
jgi:hypothetical protein